MWFTRVLSTLPIDRNKLTVYECGNIPNEESLHNKEFKVKFFKVGLVYLIFDLETLWLFPIYNIDLNLTIYLTILLFIIILAIGVYYEYTEGLLDNI